MPMLPSRAECRRDPVARIGFWIVLGVVLAVVAAWTLWWRVTNEPRVHLTLFFRGSVHGVDIGSPVKISGVQVGQIESLAVRVPTSGDDRYYAAVRVVMDGDLLASKGLPRELEDPVYLADEIRRGLRARLRLISPMTGDMYVELEYLPDEPAIRVAASDEPIAEVPTLGDPLSSGIIGVTHKLAEMEKRDFEAAGRELIERLAAIDRVLPPSAFRDAGDEAKQRLETIRAAIADRALREKLAGLNADLALVKTKLADYRENKADAAEVFAALDRARGTLEAASRETEKISRALDPRSPALLVTYARFAMVRDNAARVGRLCDDIVRANGYVGALFKAVSTDPETGGAK